MKMRRPLGPKAVSNGSLSSADVVSTRHTAAGWGAARATLALVGVAGAALLLGGCVEDVDPMTPIASSAGSAGMGSVVVSTGGSAGSNGSGGNTAGGNTSGSGGTGANPYTSDPTFAAGIRCPAITQALLTDFTYVTPPSPDAGADGGAAAGPAPNPTGVTFGDFTNTLSGSTFVYPTTGAYTLSSDVTNGSWHMTGTLGTYSGFGVVLVGCTSLDASAYKGISFTVQGSVPMGNTITFNVNTAANDISHLWLNTAAMPLPSPPAGVNAGRCIPAAAQYDGSCAAPNRSIPVTAERTTVSVLWADLVGGRPAATVDPKEITNLSWNFPPPVGAGTPTPTTYDVDLTIDDLQFIAP